MKIETIHKCPVCQRKYSTGDDARKCRDRHPPDVERWVFCEICGAGWNADYHGHNAQKEAKECERIHHEKGEAEAVARKTFFMTGGQHGKYTEI